MGLDGGLNGGGTNRGVEQALGTPRARRQSREVGGKRGSSGLEGLSSDGVLSRGDEMKASVVRRAKVFSRVEPSHKSRIVEFLQRDGEISAMVSTSF